MSDQSAEQKRHLAPVETPRQKTQSKYLQIRDLRKYQHYKDRNPPWVKLYGEQLEDYEFQQLPDATKFHALALTWLASKTENKIPFDSTWVASRIGAQEPVDFEALIRFGFLEPWQPRLQEPGPGEQLPLPAGDAQGGDQGVSAVGTSASGDASKVLATCYQVASTETETEAETEAHTEADTAPASADRCCGCCGKNVFSRFPFDDAFVLVQIWKQQGKVVSGRLIENVGGLARKLHQEGTADGEIEEMKRPKPPKREFTDAPCSKCFGAKSEVVQGKGARPCTHCVDEIGQRTGREPKSWSDSYGA